MAEPILFAILGANLVALLLLGFLLVRRQARVSEQAVGDRVVAQLQPALAPVSNLHLLPPFKQGVDERLPAMADLTGKIHLAVAQANQALAVLHVATQATPEIRQKVGVLEEQLKRLQSVERNLEQLTRQFLGAQTRGAKGEDAVRQVFRPLPTDLWQEQVGIDGGRVDFAVTMPNGRLLPIDSKTTGVQAVEQYLDLADRIAASTDDDERQGLLRDQRRLDTRVRQAVLAKAQETARYIQPSHGTLALAVQAVPDGLYQILDPKTLRDAAERNVQIVPYGLLLPVVNILRSQNQYDTLDFQAVVSAMQSIRAQRDGVERALVNKFERAAGYIQSGVEDVRGAMRRIDAELASAEATGDRAGPVAKRGRKAAART